MRGARGVRGAWAAILASCRGRRARRILRRPEDRSAMITAEQNELMTRVGPGTGGGKLLRSYWQPAALVDELEGERPVRPVRLLGEDLVLFRDEQGRHGLLDRTCPHRRADLSYGRREDGGLRCAFHGWLFDVNGRCLDTPAEPDRQPAVRVGAAARAIRSWSGTGSCGRTSATGEPPAFPELDCFVAPVRVHVRVQGLLGLQLAAGARDRHRPGARVVPAPLHRGRGSGGSVYGRQFRAASASSDDADDPRAARVPQAEARPRDRAVGLPHLRAARDRRRRACTSA